MRLVLSALLLAASSAALAHPGHAADGLLLGLAHPLANLDHLAAMLAVGACAARFRGPPRWILLVASVAALTALSSLHHGEAGFVLGMLFATVLLHGAGLLLALQLERARRWLLVS